MRRASGIVHSLLTSSSGQVTKSELLSASVPSLDAFGGVLPPPVSPLVSSPSVAVPRRPHVRPPGSFSERRYHDEHRHREDDSAMQHASHSSGEDQSSWHESERGGYRPVSHLAAAAATLAAPALGAVIDEEDIRNVRDEMVAIMENKEFSPEQVTVFSSVCRIAEDKNVQSAIFDNPEFKSLFYASQGGQLRLEGRPSAAAGQPPIISPPVELTAEEFVERRVMLCHKCAGTLTIEECETDSDEHCHSDAESASGSPGTPPPPSPLSAMAGAANLVIPLVCATLMGVLFVKYGDVISVTVDAFVHKIDLREWGRFLILGAMESFFGRRFFSRKL